MDGRRGGARRRLPALLNHGAAINVLRYYLHRPTEDGSVPAGLSVLLDWHGANWIATFHSVNVVSAITVDLSLGFELAGVGACLWVGGNRPGGASPSRRPAWPRSRSCCSVPRCCSGQYLIWLMPLWALYRLRVTWLLAAAANLIVFPYVVSAAGLRVPARARLRRRPDPHVLRPRRAHRGRHGGRLRTVVVSRETATEKPAWC